VTTPADDEADVLDSPACTPLLQALAAQSAPGLAAIERFRRQFGAHAFSAASRIAQARRKAHGKLPAADRLWLDPVRVEQATHQVVAEHKALRFKGMQVADLCCGAGGDTFALAASASVVIALDRDRDTLRRLVRNLATLRLSGQVMPVLGDAAAPPFPSDFLIHIDPDRRAGDRSRRPTRQVEDYQPGVAVLVDLMRRFSGGAVKLGPAADFDLLEASAGRAGVRFETELVSLNGECKEATLWFGLLAGPSPRRATMLPEGCSVTGRGLPASGYDDALDSLECWLYELDPALIRSGLANGFAAENALKPLTTDNAWLAGPVFRNSPWFQPFEVVEALPADRKLVRSAARKLGWNAAVVKTRGGLSADQFAAWFDAKPAGTARETLLIVKLPSGKLRAILALRHIREVAAHNP